MKKITNLEISSITYFLMHAYFIGITFNSLINTLKQDSYLGVLVGFVIGFIPLLIFLYIFNYEPNLNLNEKNIKLFGRKLGNIINFIIMIYTFILITTVFSNLVTIIHSDYLSKTPIILVIITLIIPIYYSVHTGLKSICRSSLIFLYIAVILSFISNLGLLIQVDINNFKPFFYHNNNLISGSFYYLIYNVLPLYLINIIPKNEIKNNNKTNKYIVIFYIISSISLLFVNLNIIGIFGIKLSLLYQYPEFQILKHVSIIGLSSRLDSILFIEWILDILMFIIIGLYYLVSTTHSFIDEKNNIFLTIYCILMISLTLIIPNDLFINILSLKILPIIITIMIIFILMALKIYHSRKIKS